MDDCFTDSKTQQNEKNERIFAFYPKALNTKKKSFPL